MNSPVKGLLAAVSLALLTPLAAVADDAHHKAAAATGAVAADTTDGEIRKVDKDNKKVTIKHGEIKNLEMPPMTMVFQVKEMTMLDKVQPGDKVRFKVEKVGSAFMVTELTAAK